jgi:hypothetical protein
MVLVQLPGRLAKPQQLAAAGHDRVEQLDDGVAEHQPGASPVVERLERLLGRLLADEAGLGIEALPRMPSSVNARSLAA